MTWSKITTPSLPSSITSTIPGAITGINNAFSAVLQSLQTLTQAVALVQRAATISPMAVAINTAISQIQAIIANLLNAEAGLYYLNVPIIPTNRTPVVPIVPLDALAANNYNIPLNSFNTYSPTGSGGNLGFYNTVLASVTDQLDSERPVLGPNDSVTCFVLMFGAPQVGVAIDSALALISLVGALGTGLDRNLALVPQNLRIRKVPGTLNYTLSWDNPFAEKTLDELGPYKLRVKRIYVYRKSVTAGPLPVNATRDAIKQYEIATLDNSVSKYVDDITGLTDPTTSLANPRFNYSVGYQLEAEDGTGVKTGLQNISLSNMVTTPLFRRREIAPYSRGVPPDWNKISKSMDVFPAVQEFLVFIQAYVNSIATSLSNTNTGLTTISTALKRVIAQTQRILQQVATYIDRILLSLKQPPLGLYATSFSGLGGNAFMLSTLAHVLTDKTDTNRPPFDIGSELVGGIVLVASAQATGLTNLINFFGASGGIANPIATAIKSVQQITQAVGGLPSIGSDMKPSVIGAPFPKGTPSKTQNK